MGSLGVFGDVYPRKVSKINVLRLILRDSEGIYYIEDVHKTKNANNPAILHAFHIGLALIYSVQKCAIYNRVSSKGMVGGGFPPSSSVYPPEKLCPHVYFFT